MAALKQGRFITVEGGEGVGKSSFVKGLAAALRERGKDVVTSREPGGTPVADAVRALFANPPGGEPLSIVTEALLVSAGRAQHCDLVINPAVAAGKWMLCDRFADSMRVYQGVMGGLGAEATEQLIAISTRGCQPDLTFVLDCPVQVSLARLRGRNDAETGNDAVSRYDAVTQAEHEQRRAAYLDLLRAHPKTHVLIDAAKSTATMVADALLRLEECFGPF